MKALIITGKLVQDHEFIYPYYRLQEEGYEVDVATPDKEPVTGYLGAAKITPTHSVRELNTNDYSILILPGGAKCMEYLRQDSYTLQYISAFHFNKKNIIGSICHAAQLLISAGLVKGRRISGYYSIKDDIVNAGGDYVDAPYVISDRIITSPHYKHLGPWMREVFNQAAIYSKK